MKQPTHWLTLNEDEWEIAEFILHNECEDWWNPEEGEYAVVNPTKEFRAWCTLHSLELYGD
jgi:hypothetical protein